MKTKDITPGNTYHFREDFVGSGPVVVLERGVERRTGLGKTRNDGVRIKFLFGNIFSHKGEEHVTYPAAIKHEIPAEEMRKREALQAEAKAIKTMEQAAPQLLAAAQRLVEHAAPFANNDNPLTAAIADMRDAIERAGGNA